MWIWIILGILALVVFWFIVSFNGFVVLRNRVNEAWSDIDVQLKRRHNLIPNLLETVKGYAKHETAVFTKVTEARAAAINAGAGANAAKAGAENMLSGALKSLFAVAEAYPELKANENFKELQTELTDTEDKIAASRRFYNGNVRDYNIRREVFPHSIVAGMFNFAKKDLFEIQTEEEREVPKIDFS